MVYWGIPGLVLGFDFCVSGYLPNSLSFAIVGDRCVPYYSPCPVDCTPVQEGRLGVVYASYLARQGQGWRDVVSRRGRLAFRNTDLGLKWAASSARLMYLKVFEGRV